jgi:hypothetical protein
LITLAFFAALYMATLSALYASEKLYFILSWLRRFFEASSFSVTYMVALLASDDVGLSTLSSLMANLVAFEAHFLVAVEGLMGIFSAEDAGQPLCLVRALLRHVAKLLAVMTLYGDVFCSPVSLTFTAFFRKIEVRLF